MRDPKDDVGRIIMFIERHVETKGICTIAKCIDTDVFWLYYRDPEGQEYMVHPALGAFLSRNNNSWNTLRFIKRQLSS